jgi:hypothetical protein
VLTNDVIRTKVNGILKGAVIISEKQMTDNSYEVVISLAMYGKKDSLSQSINLAEQFKAANPDVTIIPPPVVIDPVKPVEPPAMPVEPVKPVEPPVLPIEPVKPVEPPVMPVKPADPIVLPIEPIVKPMDPAVSNSTTRYTGLIIDCRGLGLSRAQCPRILDQNNNNLWSNLNVSSEVLNVRGIAGYYLSDNDSRIAERVGKNPLKITALRTSGKFFKTDAVISQANAELIRTENAKTKFLEKLNVAFLTDK